MNAKVKKPELLAPAGNVEKMKVAFEFGADAVYFGLPDFSLRVRINQFEEKSIEQAAKYCRSKKKKFYVTLNIYAHEKHLKKLPKHLELISKIKPDGVIVSDPGVLSMLNKKLPKQEVHLSTQANATNSEAIKFWSRQGISRVILARELCFDEIKAIKKAAPKVELECFVHGAMCMSYSGRCILSKWMTDRSANLGDCAQPCRWKYFINQKSKSKNQNYSKNEAAMSVIDDQRRFEMGLEEDQHGTYFFNSMDLNMIRYIGRFFECGVDSLKIEGRAKSEYYVAIVVRAYRKAIDAVHAYKIGKIDQSQLQEAINEQEKELNKISNRGYSTGFFLKAPEQLSGQSAVGSDWMFVGVSCDRKSAKKRKLIVHNVLKQGDEVEVITAEKNCKTRIVTIETSGKRLKSAHGGQGKTFTVEFSQQISGFFLLHKLAN